MVVGAEGPNKAGAIMEARKHALIYAARSMTADRVEKKRVGKYVAANLKAVLEFSQKAHIRSHGVSDDGNQLKISVVIAVRTKDLRLRLVEQGVLTDDNALMDEIGSPTVLVSWGPLVNKPKAFNLTGLGRIVTAKVASFFTDKLWNVVDANSLKRARENRQAHQALKGLVPDPNVQLALQTGADIYVTFEVIKDGRGRHATATVKAVDTVTNQMLATQVKPSSRSYDMSTPWAKVYSDALSNAMPALFEQVRGQWQMQARKGRKYKFVVRGDFTDKHRRRAVGKVLKGLGTKFKREEKTESLISGILWSKNDMDEIEEEFEDGVEDAGFTQAKPVVAKGALFIYELR
jgi:hypothetical protein